MDLLLVFVIFFLIVMLLIGVVGLVFLCFIFLLFLLEVGFCELVLLLWDNLGVVGGCIIVLFMDKCLFVGLCLLFLMLFIWGFFFVFLLFKGVGLVGFGLDLKRVFFLVNICFWIFLWFWEESKKLLF